MTPSSGGGGGTQHLMLQYKYKYPERGKYMNYINSPVQGNVSTYLKTLMCKLKTETNLRHLIKRCDVLIM